MRHSIILGSTVDRANDNNFMFRRALVTAFRTARVFDCSSSQVVYQGFIVRKMATTVTGHLNRLATAKSPYLRQHATNPVDWYPFSKEALDKAKTENKVQSCCRMKFDCF